MLASKNYYKNLKDSSRSEELETLSTGDLNGYMTGKGRGNSSLFLCPLRLSRLRLLNDPGFYEGSPLPGGALLLSLYIDPVKVASVEYNGRYFYKTAKSVLFCAILHKPARTDCRATPYLPEDQVSRLTLTT